MQLFAKVEALDIVCVGRIILKQRVRTNFFAARGPNSTLMRSNIKIMKIPAVFLARAALDMSAH